MKTTKALKWRYACKKFNPDKKLSNKKIKRLQKAFKLTATSFGLFPLKMLIIKDEKTKNILLEHAYYQKQITDCSHLLIICTDTKIDDSTIDAHFDLEKEKRGVKEDDISKFRQNLKDSFAKQSETEKEQGAKNQAYIALGNLMTVCALEKIDACPMEGFNSQKFDELLDLKNLNLKSILLLPVGYRAKDDFMSDLKKVRKPLKEIIIKI
jgi:nitroreductase